MSSNRLTSTRLVTGLNAIGSFASSVIGWGGPLFIISAVLDRADGEPVNLPGKTSRVGHYYDLCNDYLVYVLLFPGIALGFHNGPAGGWAVIGGMIAAACITLS